MKVIEESRKRMIMKKVSNCNKIEENELVNKTIKAENRNE